MLVWIRHFSLEARPSKREILVDKGYNYVIFSLLVMFVRVCRDMVDMRYASQLDVYEDGNIMGVVWKYLKFAIT